MALNKESIFRGIAARKPKVEKIDYVLGQEAVYVREGTAGQHVLVSELYREMVDKQSLRGFKQGVIIYYLCDESGNRVFSDDDIDDENTNEILDGGLESDISKICSDALALNGFTDLWAMMDVFKAKPELKDDDEDSDDEEDGEEKKSAAEKEIEAAVKN